MTWVRCGKALIVNVSRNNENDLKGHYNRYKDKSREPDRDWRIKMILKRSVVSMFH